MRTSPQQIDVQSHLIELAAILQRRFADLLLFCVTAAALIVLFLLTPSFGIVGRLYVLQHFLVLGLALTRSEPLITDHSVPSNIAVGVAYLCPYAQVICLYWWPGKVAWPEGGLVLVTLAAVFSVVCLLTLGKSVRRPSGAERTCNSWPVPTRASPTVSLLCDRSYWL